MSSLKGRLAHGDIATMALVNYTSPALVEHLGALDFDMVLIDCEKGSATTERIEEMCRAARAAGVVSVVRPWATEAGLISRYLDLGADGVMIAGVETPAEARSVVEAVRYARWKDHEHKFVFAMIESPAAIDRLPELLQVDGIDVWFIGPNDLAHRMGMPGRADHPSVRSAVRGALAAIRDAGRVGGTVAAQDISELIHAGARVVLTRVTDLLRRGTLAFQAELPASRRSTTRRRTVIEQEVYRHSTQGTTLVVAPQASGIGAEIQGVDLAAELSSAATRQLKEALHRYGVVVIRGQHLQPEQQVHVAKSLGEPRVSFYNRYAVPGHPELSVVSNIVEAGQAIGIADAGMLWHTDASYLKTPDLYTVLYGIEIPHQDGKALGDTLFASSWLAYESLPEDLRTRIANLRAVHSFSWHLERKRERGQLKRAPLTPEQRAATPDVDHPVVRRHPVTERPCLFVTEGHTASIAGLPEAEGQELLDRLIAHATRPEFIYRHSWKPGDLIIWDNCLVQHLAVFDYGDIPRRLHRSGIAGPVPV